MAILSRGQSFASGDQVTAQKLQDIVDLATFDDPADESTIVKDSGTGKLKVPSNGIGSNELASDASTDANRAVDTDHIKDGSVTAAKLDSAAVSVLMPTASLMPYAGTSAPTGYFLCDGSAKSRTTYSALFGIIGTTYGAGDLSTTFNIPDLRGRVIAGNGGTLLSGSADAIGATNAHSTKTHTLVAAEMQHTNSTPTTTHAVNGGTGGITAPFSANTGNISATTATAHNNVQPTIILNYIIKT